MKTAEPQMIKAEAPANRVASAVTSDVAELPSGRATVVGSVAGKLLELPALALIFTVVPRLLGPTPFGEFALGFFVVTLGSACVALSGAALMSRFVAVAPAMRREAVAYALAVDVARRRVAQIVILAAFGALLTLLFPKPFEPRFTAVVLVSLALDLLATICFQVALGLGRSNLWSFRYAIQNSTILVSALLLATLAGTGAAIGGILAGSLMALVIGLAAVVRPLARGRSIQDRAPALSTDASQFRTLKGISNVLTQLAHRSGVILVAVITGSSVETGHAALAIGAGLTATYAIWQVFTVQLPAHSEQTARDRSGVEDALRRFAIRTELVAVALALLAAALLDPAVELLLGERFTGARGAFAPAIALVALAPIAALGSQLATLRLRPDVEVRATAFGAAVFFAVAFATVPVWGATGAAVALLLATVATVAGLAIGLRDAISGYTTTVAIAAAALLLAVRAIA